MTQTPPDLFCLFPHPAFTRYRCQSSDYTKDNLMRLAGLVERIVNALQLTELCFQKIAELRQQRPSAPTTDVIHSATPEQLQHIRDERSRICGVIKIYSAWICCAGRDIAVTIEDFWRALLAAKNAANSGDCQALRIKILPIIERAMHTFLSFYPIHKQLRNSACHLVDYSKSPKDFENNSLTGDAVVKSEHGEFRLFSAQGGGRGFIGEAIGEGTRTISYTGYGQLQTLELTDTVVERLARIVVDCYRELEATVGFP